MKFQPTFLGAATATVVAIGSLGSATSSQAATLAPGQFTITGENVSQVTGFSNADPGSTFTLNLDLSPLSIADTQGVFAGVTGLTGTPNVAPLLLTVVNSTTFSFSNKVPFITGLKQNGQDIFFDLAEGTLGGFITSSTNYSFGGVVKGILRNNSGSVIADGSLASFDIGSGAGSNRSSITLETVPTPALLPGLVGFGIAALRKRKAIAAESES
ncbi:MAG TPA: PTPA-CTERM sorting domain-containing protein [Leptolyngbyaceae cyanobacterium M33_DOE_097]|uniref:PTPA-CTERM sorting domain-containing protein n=1 Tax=Oscillatoriales cyanobacterium SpSt-418 TaxID=2282169 RepID=A0A7C3PDS5_9CYAN|nr:PTPA-CTERM sorting domain-containing protein [Leptolyngbyaceae cyanobacterium M33_DOE_097]